MKDIWVLKSACSKQETLYSGQAFPMISVRLWKNVEFVKQVPGQLNQLGNVSDMPPHAWHTLGTNLFYWNKIDYLVVRDYFSKYLIVRRLPNSSTHMP